MLGLKMYYKRLEITKISTTFLLSVMKPIFISGPIPTSGQGDESYSKLMNLNTWLHMASTLLTILKCSGNAQLGMHETGFS